MAGELGSESASQFVLTPRPMKFFRSSPVWLGPGATCGIIDGAVHCQGSNGTGLFANGTVDALSHPEPHMVPVLSDIASLDIRGPLPCAVSISGAVVCWGGRGRADPTSPMGVSGAGMLPVAAPEFGRCSLIVSSSSHRCALRCDGRVVCVGSNRSGECGRPPSDNLLSAAVVEGLDHVVDLVVGDAVSCALRDDRTMWCWGSNDWGELGSTMHSPAWRPAPVPGLTAVSRMSASLAYEGGGTSVCAVDSGQLRCWGHALGVEQGSGVRVDVPTAVPGLSGPIVDVALGKLFGIASGPSGEVYCWGVAGSCGRDPGTRGLLLPVAVRIDLPGG